MASLLMIHLVFVTLAIVMLLCTLILHHVQHFRCKCGKFKAKDSSSSLMQLVENNTRGYIYCCTWTNSENGTIKFFPVSFFFYLVLMILLCILIMVKILIDPFTNQPFIFSIQPSLQLNNTSNIYILFLDYVLIYGIMILSVWESLHAFYSFYTTFFAAIYGYFVSNSMVIKKFFLFYGFIFIAIYTIRVHLLSWFCVLIVLFHVVFNTYCTLKFASILIGSYQVFAEQDQFAVMDKQMQNAYFMKKVSIICCILQSIYLCIFTISCYMDTIYYLPILWAISAFIYCLNFMRNRVLFLRAFSMSNATKAHTNIVQTPHKSSTKIETNTKKPRLNVTGTLTINVEAPSVEETDTTPKKNDKALHLLGLTTPNSENRTPIKGLVFHHSVNLSILPTFGDFIVQKSKRKSTITPVSKYITKPQIRNSKSNPTKPFYASKLKLNALSLSNPILIAQKGSTPMYDSSENINVAYDMNAMASLSPITITTPQIKFKDMDVIQEDHDEQIQEPSDINVAVRSMRVLAQNGFYSKQNVNNIYQLKQYLA